MSLIASLGALAAGVAHEFNNLLTPMMLRLEMLRSDRAGDATLLTSLRAIEDAIPGTGKGEEKLSAIRAILEAVDSGAAKYWPQIQSVIGVLVGLFNRTGAFKTAG